MGMMRREGHAGTVRRNTSCRICSVSWNGNNDGSSDVRGAKRQCHSQDRPGQVIHRGCGCGGTEVSPLLALPQLLHILQTARQNYVSELGSPTSPTLHVTANSVPSGVLSLG